MSGLEQILHDLAGAQQALRQSSTAFDRAMVGLRATLDAVAAANEAQGKAIDAIVTATDAALLLVQGRGGTQ